MLDYTADVTGKGFEFREHTSDLEDTWASVKVARGDMPNHLVLYHPDHAARLGYLVAHECGHILRLRQAPPEYRKLPATRAEHRWRVAYELAQDLCRMESLGLKASRLAVLLRMWHDGAIRQLVRASRSARRSRWSW